MFSPKTGTQKRKSTTGVGARFLFVLLAMLLAFAGLAWLPGQSAVADPATTRVEKTCYTPGNSVVCDEDFLHQLIAEAGTTPTQIGLGGGTETLITKQIVIGPGQDIEFVTYPENVFGDAPTYKLTREDGFTDPMINVQEGGKLTFSSLVEGGDVQVNARGEWVNTSSPTMIVNGEFVMNSGKIYGARNVSGTYAGAVTVSGKNARFELNGGEVTDNWRHTDSPGSTQYGAGNIFVKEGATFVMNGGSVTKGQTYTQHAGYGEVGGIGASKGGHVVINGGEISENTGAWAGAISLWQWDYGNKVRNDINNLGEAAALEKYQNQRVTLEINGGVIKNNTGGYAAGAIQIFGNASAVMNGGTISGNSAGANGGAVNAMDLYMWGADKTYTEIPGEKDRFGGTAEEWAKYSPAAFTMNGGTITANKSGWTGGGVNVVSNQVRLTGGTISNNEAKKQGGGVYVATKSYAVQLEDALVTENTAGWGGGMWMCPTGSAKIYVTNGGAIFGNSAQEYGNDLAHYPYGGSGAYESYFAKKMLGFGDVSYYLDGTYDNPTPRFDAANPGREQVYLGNVPAEKQDPSKDYKTKLLNEGLQNVSTEKAHNDARAFAKLIITGNSAPLGGGIGTNGGVKFGYDDTELNVTKTWADKDGSELTKNLPESVTVQLKTVLTNNAGETVNLDAGEPVALNKNNGWKHTFVSLPKRISSTADYPAQEVTYTVEEAAVAGFTPKIEVKTAEDGTYTAEVKNTKQEVPPPSESPSPSPTPKPRVPKTGANFGLPAILAAMVATGAALVMRNRRKAQ